MDDDTRTLQESIFAIEESASRGGRLSPPDIDRLTDVMERADDRCYWLGEAAASLLRDFGDQEIVRSAQEECRRASGWMLHYWLIVATAKPPETWPLSVVHALMRAKRWKSESGRIDASGETIPAQDMIRLFATNQLRRLEDAAIHVGVQAG